MYRILFICHGNICRSPMAQCVLQKLVDDAGLTAQCEIDSAAVSREETGNPIYPPAAAELRRHGIPLIPHHARRVTPEDIEHFDVLVCMDYSNRSRLGDAAWEKARLLGRYAGFDEVDDPWYTHLYDLAYQDIERGCRAMLALIKQGQAL